MYNCFNKAKPWNQWDWAQCVLVFLIIGFPPQWTGKLAFGQVPLYEEPGLALVQSGTIVRYLAKKHGYNGANEQEALHIDVAYEGAQDLLNQFVIYKFVIAEDKKEEARQRLVTETLPTQLGYFAALLEKNGNNGFLVGSKVRSLLRLHFTMIKWTTVFRILIPSSLPIQLSYADLALYAILNATHLIPELTTLVTSYPAVQNFVEGVANRDRINAYRAKNVYNLN